MMHIFLHNDVDVISSISFKCDDTFVIVSTYKDYKRYMSGQCHNKVRQKEKNVFYSFTFYQIRRLNTIIATEEKG